MSPLSAITPAMSGLSQIPEYDFSPTKLAPASTPGVSAPTPLDDTSEVSPAAAPSGSSFASMLGNMVQDVNAKQFAASDAVNGLQSGQGVPLHQAVIAMEEANVSFQLMVEVRNKLMDSYQEIMRMSI
jgi:flagellar hook-basal body complex protein FliE